MSCLCPTPRKWSGKDARYESRVSRLLHAHRIRVTSLPLDKSLLAVCVPFHHFIGVTRVSSIEWKSHKPILYLTSATTDYSRIKVGFSLGVYKVRVSSFRSPELVSCWKQLQIQEEVIRQRDVHYFGTKFWRSAKVTCQYPDHDGVRKRIQGRDVITLQSSQDIRGLFWVIIPVGSGSLQ